MRKVAIAALAGAVLSLAATTALARPGATFDLGDAPDGTSARYGTKPSVIGAFPSKAGPRLGGGGPRLGAGWSADAASRQVDRDRDDRAGLGARSCGVSTLDVVLDLSRVRPGTPVYVNAWFDWNQDGDWADGGNATCGPEWGVQNHRVDRSELDASGVGVFRLRFRAGRVPAEYWWRLQVHAGAPAPHAAGAGTTGSGEIEDFRVGPRESVEPVLYCISNTYPHGSHAAFGPPSVHFALVASGPGNPTIGPGSVVVRLTGDTDGIKVRPVQHPTFVDVFVESREHSRKAVIQTAFVEVELRAVWASGNRVVRARCAIDLVHTKPVARPYRAARVTAPAARVVVNPDKPTPEAAKCAASIVDGYAFFRARTTCKAVDIKSTTLWIGGKWIVLTGPSDDARPQLKVCRRDSGTGAVKCFWKPGNVGRVLEYRFAPEQNLEPPYRITLHVLAGGHGETGTSIVLRQEWWALGGGDFRCAQVIPRAAECARAP